MNQPAADVTNAPIFGSDDPSTGREYEFSDADNAVFRGLSGAMRVVAVGNAALAAVLLLSAAGGMWLSGRAGMASGVAESIAAGLAAVNFIWLRGAAAEVYAIADTRGSDVTHLMHAMSALRSMFTLQRTLLYVAGAIALPGILVAVFLLMHTPRG